MLLQIKQNWKEEGVSGNQSLFLSYAEGAMWAQKHSPFSQPALKVGVWGHAGAGEFSLPNLAQKNLPHDPSSHSCPSPSKMQRKEMAKDSKA